MALTDGQIILVAACVAVLVCLMAAAIVPETRARLAAIGLRLADWLVGRIEAGKRSVRGLRR